jgi:magnesium-protoporphyrin IX monomethyl ester (oxidative) cyclase
LRQAQGRRELVNIPLTVSHGSALGQRAKLHPELPDSKCRPIRRVQLFFPPMVVPRFQSRQTALFPLGLGYVAMVLERAGYETAIVDCASEGYETLVDIGKERIVYGLTSEHIRERIEEYRPDAIGISCLFSTLENRMLMIAEIAKKTDPDIVVVVGGPHVSASFERLIRNPAVDYCVDGEGEVVVEELFNALNRGDGLESIAALCFRQGGRAAYSPRERWITNLDTLAFPARHLVDMETYFRIAEPQGIRLDGNRRVRAAQMTTSRGCPFQCTYCAKDITWGKAYRTRSADNVLDEMEHLIDTYQIERFAFQDDNFTADMQRAEEIFDGIVARGFNITWEAPNGLGVNFLDPPLLEKMKASGCDSFTIAVESANSVRLRKVRKPNYIKLAPPIVQKAKDLDIEVRGFFMIGFPGETLEEVHRTVEYARGLGLAVTNYAIVTPLPGTVLYKECVEAGLLDEETVDFEDFAYGAFEIQLAEVPNEQLKVIRKIEWMRTIFLDRDGQIRHDLRLKQEDLLDELAKAMVLFPENEEIRGMYRQARQYYGLPEEERVARASA